MGRVKLLDCTLRDGGYINDWNFGENAITGIVKALVNTNVDILEIGFIKNEKYNRDRTIFNQAQQIKEIIFPKNPNIQYAAMIEVVNPIPLEQLDRANEETVDIIRVIVWKRLLNEGYEYCKGIIEKGYKLCVQPARVDQYTDQEFIEMIKLFNQLNPLAIYVVDSWGTQYTDSLIKYVVLADKYLQENIAIGYHGHNNMMQAFGVAENFLKLNLVRDKIIDSSVYGIGRGAGNLNTELIAKFLNEFYGKDYKISPMMDIYDKFLKRIFDTSPWGYSVSFFLTAVSNCNPNYASYYGMELGLSALKIEAILNELSEEDKIIYSQEKADKYLNDWEKKNGMDFKGTENKYS